MPIIDFPKKKTLTARKQNVYNRVILHLNERLKLEQRRTTILIGVVVCQTIIIGTLLI